MATSEIEMGIIRGKRQTMISVSTWISEKVRLARETACGENSALVLELTLASLEGLLRKMEGQIRDGVRTLDCGDFLPE